MRIATILVGVVAITVVPGLALFTVSERAAGAVFLLFALATLGAGFVPRRTLVPERDTERVTAELNAIAAKLAGERGVLVADGFTPLSGRAASATHMTETPPDIHPREAGHDALASALLDAIG